MILLKYKRKEQVVGNTGLLYCIPDEMHTFPDPIGSISGIFKAQLRELGYQQDQNLKKSGFFV